MISGLVFEVPCFGREHSKVLLSLENPASYIEVTPLSIIILLIYQDAD